MTIGSIRHWLTGWRLAILLAVFLGCLLLTFAWWLMYDDTDLVQVRERAAREGVPTTWAAVGLKQDPARMAIWNEIAALISDKKLQSASNQTPAIVRQRFSPASPELIAHHAGMDPIRLLRLLGLIDQLGSDPLTLQVAPLLTTKLPEIGLYRQVARLLQERAVIAAEAEAPDELRRLLDFVRSFESRTVLTLMVRQSLLTIAMEVIAERLGTLKDRDVGLAASLDTLALSQETSAIQAFRGEFIWTFDLAANASAYLSGVQASLPIQLEYRLVWRLGRQPTLNRSLDLLSLLGTHPEAKEMVRQARLLPDLPYENWDPRMRFASLVEAAYRPVIELVERTRLRALLLAAEIRGDAWPVDVFDPAGMPLRRFERDHDLIGAYSVGEDGVDDGGKKGRDDFFPLHGLLADPVPASKP